MNIRWWSALLSVFIVLIPLSCASDGVPEPPVAESGAVCIDRDVPANGGQLCFTNDDGTTRLVGSEILQGSTMTVRGGSGDDMSFVVDDNGGFSIELGGQLIERPLSATGVWSDGEPVMLIVD